MVKKDNFFKWIIRKWHFWILSIGWGIWSAYEDILYGNIISGIEIIIIWTLIIGIIYFIIFYIIKMINRVISKKIKEEIK